MHAFPKLGRRPITEIKPMEVLDVLRVVENKGQADNANRLKTLIGQVFRYAVSLGRTPHDITADLRGLLAPPDVKHYPAIVTPDEIAKLLKSFTPIGATHCLRCAESRAIRVPAPWQPTANALE